MSTRPQNSNRSLAYIQALQVDYTIGKEILDDPYHVLVIRSLLTRNLAAKFPDLKDEITTAFQDLVPPAEGEFFIKNYSWYAF